MPKNVHFALNVETRDLDFLDARNEKRKIVEIPGNGDVETRRAATLMDECTFCTILSHMYYVLVAASHVLYSKSTM